MCTLRKGVELPGLLIIPFEYNGLSVISYKGYSGSNSYKDNVKEVVIPSSILRIDDYSFQQFKNLTSIVIPNSVASIGYSCFECCSNLTSIEIPNSVTSLGNYCFYECSSLTSIEIPNSVTSIGDGCFSTCSKLTSILIGALGFPVRSSAGWKSSFITSSPKATVTIFTLNGLETDLTGSPWGGTKCTFIYERA